MVTIRGSGFGGYAKRSGTAVRGRFRTVENRKAVIKYQNGTIASWEDGRIVVKWNSRVHSGTRHDQIRLRQRDVCCGRRDETGEITRKIGLYVRRLLRSQANRLATAEIVQEVGICGVAQGGVPFCWHFSDRETIITNRSIADFDWMRARRKMCSKSLLAMATACMASLLPGHRWHDVPAPPVNQTIGMLDVVTGAMCEADCRVCHDSGISDRHHSLYGQPIPQARLFPDPDGDGDGQPDTTYSCFSCHDTNFTRGDELCRRAIRRVPHHTTPAAQSGDCASCHGDIVDSIGDGHYIPSYSPSRTTPAPSEGEGLPLNRFGNGAGACNYCHDEDDPVAPFIRNNADLHHDATLNCLWCHSAHGPEEVAIRVCENCHGPDSLHSIQADSPAPGNIGSIVVGGEDAGYGHVGRDAGPGDSDCWGCHGFARTPIAASGSLTPAVYGTDLAVIPAGTDTTMLAGRCGVHEFRR